MSDGADGNPASVSSNLVANMKKQYASIGFVAHAVAFGSSAPPTLQQLATAGIPSPLLSFLSLYSLTIKIGGGHFYSAKTGIQLNEAFGAIAANSSALDSLVQKFGDIISSMVTTKILLDYL